MLANTLLAAVLGEDILGVQVAPVAIATHEPLRLAGELGMADVLTGGRLEIGVGRGAFEYEFDRFGIDETIAAARLRDGMAIVRGLLTEDDFSYQSETCWFGPATAVPKPLQRPYPPIWAAARSPDTIKWAIRSGYNLLSTPWREPFARVEALYNQVQGLVAEVKPPVPPRFAVSRMTFVGGTDGEALEAMRAIQTNHRLFTGLFRTRPTSSAASPPPIPSATSLPPSSSLPTSWPALLAPAWRNSSATRRSASTTTSCTRRSAPTTRRR